MNLQTLRDTSNYSAFRSIAAGFAFVLIAVGILTTVVGIGVIKSFGWAAAPVIISGIVTITAGTAWREAAHLVADVPDLLIHLARQQQKSLASHQPTHRSPCPPPRVDSESDEADITQFFDKETEQAPPVQDPRTMYAASRELLSAGKRDECKILLRELIRQHPQSPEADRARKALRSQAG